MNRQQRFARGYCWIFCGFAGCFGLFWIISRAFVGCIGFLWIGVGRSGTLWTFSRSFCVAVGFCGSLWVVVGRYKLYFGLLWVIVDHFGSLQIVVDGCEWLKMVFGRCGSFWVIVDCCGWLWLVEDGFWSLWIVLGLSLFKQIKYFSYLYFWKKNQFLFSWIFYDTESFDDWRLLHWMSKPLS